MVLSLSLTISLSSSAVYATWQTDYNKRCGFTLTTYNLTGCHGYGTNKLFYDGNSSDWGYGYSQGNNILFPNIPCNGTTSGWPVPPVTSATAFINFISCDLYQGNAAYYNYNSLGAAFIVDTMLSVPAGTGGWSAIISYAQSHFSQWSQDVYYNAQQGRISWNNNVNLGPGTIDSQHVCSTTTTDKTCQQTTCVQNTCDGYDLDFWQLAANNSIPAVEITFWNPNGTTYSIDRVCGNVVLSSVNAGGPPQISISSSCGGVTVDPARIDSYTGFTVAANVNYAPNPTGAQLVSQDPTVHMYINIVGPGGYNNSSGSANIGYLNGGSYTASRGIAATHLTGSFTVQWGVHTSSYGNTDCTSSFTIADMPYFTGTQGGNLSAGPAMNIGGTNCATVPADNNAGIVSWNNESPTYSGAGTQDAALALGYLQDFVTAQNSSPNITPSGLAFSNVGFPNSGYNFGGNFASSSCVPDYTANATSFLPGPQTIGATSVANGTHTTVYVNGDVYINGNITYSGSYPNGVQDIPAYTIVAKGNIYINPSVTRLDGVYIAEPTAATPNKGIIYTCATSAGPIPLDSNLYNTCKANQLTVDGSFIARQVWLTRTYGTLGNNTPAESFGLSPDIWLSIPSADSPFSASAGQYDAISSLPPVL